MERCLSLIKILFTLIVYQDHIHNVENDLKMRILYILFVIQH